MDRKKLADIRKDMRNRGKIPYGAPMSDENVIAFCVEAVHAAMAKRLRSEVARNRARSTEDRAAADKIRRMFGHSEEDLALYGGSRNRTAANRTDADKIRKAFNHTQADLRRARGEGAEDFEAQVIEDVLRSSASEARMRPGAFGREG